MVVGAVDWGLDFDHPNFKHPDGTTRLIALWDQRGSGRASPRPYGYGTVHTQDQINAALSTPDPYTSLGYHPARADRGGGSHGTHVMDIACGNGLSGGPVGIAPDAAMVFVDLADRDTGGLANLGGSVRLCEAVDFCARAAGTRPWVLNLSVGRHGGPHDGTTLTELAFDELLDAAPGRFIVQSTGNYYQAGTHASGDLSAGQAQTLSFVIDPADMTDNEIEVWYDGNDEFSVRIDPPGLTGPEVRLGTRADIVVDGQMVGRIHHRECDPNNGDNHVDAFLYAPGHSGVWTVTIRALRADRGRFDAWIERDEACTGCQARFAVDDRDTRSSLGTIATSHLPLIVGAYDGHQNYRPVARFSSSGPTRDGRSKPDVAASGTDVLAARSALADEPRSRGTLVRKSGSSMASPHVAGAVALCLQAGGHRLSARRIRALVLGTADPAEFDRDRLGHGYLNVPALVAAAREAFPAELPPTGRQQEELVMNIDSKAVLPLMLAPATSYRELLYHPSGELSRWIGEHFDIVATPGRALADGPQRGDVLLAVTLGQAGGGQCAVLTDPNLDRRPTSDTTAHLWRALDQHRRVPHGQLLLRPRPATNDAVTPFQQHLEAESSLPSAELDEITFESGEDAAAELTELEEDGHEIEVWDSDEPSDGSDVELLLDEIAEVLPPRVFLPGGETELLTEETPPLPKGVHAFQHWVTPTKRDAATNSWIPDGAKRLLEPLDPGFLDANGEVKTGALQDALKQLLASDPAFRPAAGRLTLALVDLTGSRLLHPEFAGSGSTIAVDGASCPKVAPLYAAFQLRNDLKQIAASENITTNAELVKVMTERWKGIAGAPRLDRFLYRLTDPPALEFTAEVDEAINNIIHQHNANHAARVLIEAVGFPYIASLLWQSGLRHPTRGGLWLTSNYAGGAAWSGPAKPPPPPVFGHTATALSLATFFTLLAQDRLAPSGLPRTIRTALSTASWFTPVLPSATIASKVGLLLKCLRFEPKMKNGQPVIVNGKPVQKCTHSIATHVHEAALIENGRFRYAVAIMTTGIPTGVSLLQKLIGELDDLIRKNNP